MTASAEHLYLDLMKKTVAFLLWPEPPHPLETFNFNRSFAKRLTISFVTRALALGGLTIGKKVRFAAQQRVNGQVWSIYADTMIGLKRLDNLQECVETVLGEDVPGDLIETGVWRGGACIFMRAILKAYGVTDRKVFVADSFQGLPEPDSSRYPADIGDKHHDNRFLAVSRAEVEANFRKHSLLDDQVVFLEGWFEQTLPAAPIRHLAILRIDGDMFGSTMQVLEALYPKLSNGGFCIVDDYALAGCAAAVDAYREMHGITSEMKVVDWSGRYWRKP